MCALIHQTLLYCYITAALFSPVKHPVAKPHPLHVSTTNVEFNPKDDKLEVICTIFTDDFEAALNKQFNTHTDLSKPAQHDAMDKLVKAYLSANVHLKTGDVADPLSYLGFEVKDAQVDVYLESEKIQPFKKIEAEVGLLYNLYNDQINIVHITVNGLRKSEKLDYPQKKVVQNF